MKINMSLLEVEEALCSYLRDEFNLDGIKKEDISFKNARSVEDMYFEINIKPKRQNYVERAEKETIAEVVSAKTESQTETARNEVKTPVTATEYSVFGVLKD